MSLFKDALKMYFKSFKKTQEVVVPPNCFSVVNHGEGAKYYLETLEEGTYKLPANVYVTNPISYDEQTISIGYDYDIPKMGKVYYKLTVKYKIVDPYLYITKADKGEYISASLTDLAHDMLTQNRHADFYRLFAEDYPLNDRHAEIAFMSMSIYGVEITSACFRMSSLEEIRSVEHDEKMLMDDVYFLRGYFENTVE